MILHFYFLYILLCSIPLRSMELPEYASPHPYSTPSEHTSSTPEYDQAFYEYLERQKPSSMIPPLPFLQHEKESDEEKEDEEKNAQKNSSQEKQKEASKSEEIEDGGSEKEEDKTDHHDEKENDTGITLSIQQMLYQQNIIQEIVTLLKQVGITQINVIQAIIYIIESEQYQFTDLQFIFSYLKNRFSSAQDLYQAGNTLLFIFKTYCPWLNKTQWTTIGDFFKSIQDPTNAQKSYNMNALFNYAV